MKRESLFIAVLFVFLALLPVSLIADEKTLRFESRIIDTWDNVDSAFFSDTGEPITWEVRGSKFSTENRPRSTYVSNEWPADLFGLDPTERFDLTPEDLGVFGINGSFVRRGYNFVELIPGVGEGEDWEIKAIPLPGRVQLVDFWVWGANYNYFVEFHFLDYRGVPHVLSPIRKEQKRQLGSIRYPGWKNLFIEMPSYIKQAVSYKPSLATLSLTKIVFTTHPSEVVNDFYIYVDHLKVLTDMHESFYDGFDLTKPDRIEEIWGSEEQQQ